LSIVMLD